MYIVDMNKSSKTKRATIVRCLVDGNSIRATARIVGCSKNTVSKLLVELGAAVSEYQDLALRNVVCQRIQCDEIWSFCHAKEKNVPEHKKGQFGYGDVWTWTAICADSKLAVSWLVGRRDGETAIEFVRDLESRLSHRIQLTTDGYRAYLEAVESAFGMDVDYAMLIKLFGPSLEGETRYSPAKCTGTKRAWVQGEPRPEYVSTSYVERQNLTMRMSMRRFTRLTNAFSKKVENLAAAVSLHFMYYNFCRVHQSLNHKTPAEVAGVADHRWKIEEVIELLEAKEAEDAAANKQIQSN